jgi:hypothetical protein
LPLQSPRRYLYTSAFVADLASNHFAQAGAIDLLKMPASTFHEWMKTDGIEFIPTTWERDRARSAPGRRLEPEAFKPVA